MCEVGTTRTIEILEDCPNGTKVRCTQTQVCARQWYYLWLGTDWDDVPGGKTCPPCPQGKQLPGAKVIVCCFTGGFVLAWTPATGPGVVGFVSDLLGIGGFGSPPPDVPTLRPIRTPCIEMDAEDAKKLRDNMKKALEQMKATNFPQQDLQQKAIECLEAKMREFGWT